MKKRNFLLKSEKAKGGNENGIIGQEKAFGVCGKIHWGIKADRQGRTLHGASGICSAVRRKCFPLVIYPTVFPKEARKKAFNARKLLNEDWTHHRKEKREK